MDKRGYALLKQLISDVEGAPYPNSMGNELYTIWYEHMQRDVQEALEFLNMYDPDHGKDEEIQGLE